MRCIRLFKTLTVVLAIIIMGNLFSLTIHVKAEANLFDENEKAYIEEEKTLKVGYVSDRKPVSFTGDNGELSGISRMIFDRIAEISGLNFEYVEIPQGEITYDYLLEAGYDLVTSVEYNEENKKARGILISNPYMSSRKVIVAKEGLKFNTNDSFKVAISTGSQTIKKVIKNQYPNFEIVDYSTMEDCLEAVNKGEADLLIQNQYVVEYWLYKPIYRNLVVIPVMEMKDELCFSAVTPLDASGEKQEEGELLISIIDKSIKQMSDAEIAGYAVTSALENMYEYTFSDFAYQYRYMIIALGIALVLIIGLICMSFSFRLRSIHSKAEAKAKGDFLSAMSHEIRTPLNGLISLNYLMSQNINDRNKMTDYLKQSSAVSQYLLSLLNNILDMSKIQEKQMKLEKKPVDLELLLSAVETLEKGAMENRKINFSMDVDLVYPVIEGDAIRIQQVILNLLDNACKYTQKGGRVNLKVIQKLNNDGNILTEVHVIDNGPGMSEEFQKKIFMPFTQERRTVSQGNQGTGLGLSICALLAENMGGHLSVDSRINEGSHFTFAFLGKQSEHYDDKDKDLLQGENIAAKYDKQYILVAEDNELNGQLMVELLEGEGFKVRRVVNGKQAVKVFSESAEGECKVILMDLLMPEMNGFEATKAIRALERPDAETVKIFASTANTSQEDRDRAFSCGMDDFIAKPINISELFEKLQK